MRNLSFVWLEITGRCQLTCRHCYAESGPNGGDGAMLPAEVFSNLVRVSRELWETSSQRGVRLATSYYSDDAVEHETITKGRGSQARTKANIAEALHRSIPLRVGLVDLRDGQRVEQARAELEALGVTAIGTDHLRQVGRGVRQRGPSIDQLCGQCARGKVAVSPNGDVWPCVFARWTPVGNVRRRTLVEILTGPDMASVTATLAGRFPVPVMPCVPSMCNPECGPNYGTCGPDDEDD